jgi:hypothetical protein
MVSDSLIGQRQADGLPSSQAVLDALPLVIDATTEPASDLLSQSILEVLRLIREDLAMDMVLVTMHMDDDVVIRHAATSPKEPNVEGMSHPRDLSICQRVLEGRLPAVIPDMAALKQTHDVPPTPIVPAAFMAVPVVLASGRRYGVLCCLKSTPMLELDECHRRRLEMSAKHIARLVDEAG